MKEKFDNRLLTGPIKVTCKDDKGNIVGTWETRKEEVIEHIVELTEIARQDGFNLSLRALHYKLVSHNWILNFKQAYNKLGCIVGDCKYAGVLDWNAIKVDSAREMKIEYFVNGIPDALEDTIDQYKLDRQEGQANYIEVWCEKTTLVDVLRTVTDKYHIPLCIAVGRESSSAIYKGYQRFRKEISEGRPAILLYVGDHDPSGLDMIRDIQERIYFMLDNSKYDYNYGFDYKNNLNEGFKVIPVALTMDQVKQYSLPSNYAKESDVLYKKYVKEIGTTYSWEVDALDSKILVDLLESKILEYMDFDQYNAILESEQSDISQLKEFISTL